MSTAACLPAVRQAQLHHHSLLLTQWDGPSRPDNVINGLAVPGQTALACQNLEVIEAAGTPTFTVTANYASNQSVSARYAMGSPPLVPRPASSALWADELVGGRLARHSRHTSTHVCSNGC